MATNPDPLAQPERTVKPRARDYKALPVVAIYDGQTLDEVGTVDSVENLVARLPTLPATLFAKLSAADWLSELDEQFALRYPQDWQWRATVCEREILTHGKTRAATRVSTVVHYFGWRRAAHGSYHKIIDPVSMYGKKLDEIWPRVYGDTLGGTDPGNDTLLRLLSWAVTLRDFCAKNRIEMRPTIGSLAGQFLTDPRFYPDARRKVPAKINQRVREQLPGNHYHLSVVPTPKRNYRGLYLDQQRAHHYHARTTALPNANNLYAYGDFLTLNRLTFWQPSASFYGLYCLDMVPPKRIRRFRWLRRNPDGYTKRFVFSNELPLLVDQGWRIAGVRAAWGSWQRDTGLARYAKWADKELDAYGAPPWLKPLLLATYGVLAVRPSYGDAIFRMAKSGDDVTVHTGHNKLRGKHVMRPFRLEPRIANVLHRGMIEAATRAESLGLADWLEGQGYHVLSIYADAVIVKADDDKPLPPIPDPWRLKRTLNNLQFISQQAFTSDGMTKLPGVGREAMNYRQGRMPGYAPRKVHFEALTQKPVNTGRRI